MLGNSMKQVKLYFVNNMHTSQRRIYRVAKNVYNKDNRNLEAFMGVFHIMSEYFSQKKLYILFPSAAYRENRVFNSKITVTKISCWNLKQLKQCTTWFFQHLNFSNVHPRLPISSLFKRSSWTFYWISFEAA